MKKRSNLVLKFLILLTAVIIGVRQTAISTAKAAEVNEYAVDTTITKNGEPVTGDTTVMSNEVLSVTQNFSFPDSLAIEEGDSLSYTLPRELTLITLLDFDVRDENGELVGTARTNTADQSVSVSFTDYFTRHPERKVMSMRFNVRVNNETVTETGPVSFNFEGTTVAFRFQKEDGSAGDYEMKYGYQDSANPKIVKWRMILNARQDMLRNMTISDSFGDGLTLVPGTFRAVRYATQEEPIQNEAQLLSLPVLDNFSDKADFTTDANGGITGFNIDFGDNYNWAMYIEYSTYVPDDAAVGSEVHNTLTWGASNFPEERSITRSVRLEDGSGDGSGQRPTENNIPADPAAPTDPSNDNPTDPGTSDPANPANPTDPGTSDPANPANPTDPGTSDPANPANPTDPGTSDPANPTDPGASDPESGVAPPARNTGGTSGTGTDNGGQGTPGNSTGAENGTGDPAVDQADSVSVTANGSKTVLPKTGEQNGLWLSAAGLIFLTAAGSFMLVQKKRTNS